MPAPRVTVVVPTLDEVTQVGPLVRGLLAEAGVEVVVADGGSSDGTREEAAAAGARVVAAPRGRAAQMNAGAAAAGADVLVFLHADTTLPGGFPELVLRALELPGAAVGGFRLATDSPRLALRVIECVANWRARGLGIFYGDQAIFIRREVFESLGGYRVVPLLEDRDLVRRARRRGKVVLLDRAVVTSARRWHEQGPWRTTLRHAVIGLAFEAGVSPGRLARWYRRLGA